MSWKEPGRARHLVVVSERGATQEYSREEGADDPWFGASGFPNPTVFQSGPTMTSAELVEVIGVAIYGRPSDHDGALERAKRDRDEAEDERDDAQAAARDFADALQEMLRTEDPDVWRIATEALARHPEYDSG